MEPVQVIGVPRLSGLDGQFVAAVDGVDVLDAGRGLGQLDLAILDDGGGAYGVEGFEFRRCQQGRALVILEFIVDAEFFAEEDDLDGGVGKL